MLATGLERAIRTVVLILEVQVYSLLGGQKVDDV
jgi:hypothetical protein